MFKSLKMWLLNLVDSDRGYSPVVFSSFVLQEHLIIETLIEEDHRNGSAPIISDAATSILMRLNHVAGRCSATHYLNRMSSSMITEVPIQECGIILGSYTLPNQYRIVVRYSVPWLYGEPKDLAIPSTLLNVDDIPTHGDSDYIKPNKDLCDAIHPDLWERVSERK